MTLHPRALYVLIRDLWAAAKDERFIIPGDPIGDYRDHEERKQP